MISNKRIEILKHCFWQETGDEETREWRKYLNGEEKKFIDELEKQFNINMKNLYEEAIKKMNK